ncbi:MAG: gamma carbonic anhydrase family protein [Gemmatimonadota bacterium]|nr:MAG: gamma carbonic anhydrase family protein [Gemmatimonadota bacterium]
MIDPSVFIAPGAKVVGEVTIGPDSSIWYNSVVRGDLAPVSIGAETNIQDLSVLHVDEEFPCTVGDRVGVGHRAILHGCTVEDECLIGMGAVVLNGVHVGTGSVVGAGALLTEGMQVPPGSVVMGVPAKVVRAVDDELRGRIRLTWRHYLDQARSHKAGQVKMHGATPPADL